MNDYKMKCFIILPQRYPNPNKKFLLSFPRKWKIKILKSIDFTGFFNEM